jgi:hypothetical protein
MHAPSRLFARDVLGSAIGSQKRPGSHECTQMPTGKARPHRSDVSPFRCLSAARNGIGEVPAPASWGYPSSGLLHCVDTGLGAAGLVMRLPLVSGLAIRLLVVRI